MIPLGIQAPPPCPRSEAGSLVAAFLSATAPLSCEIAALAAGVRPATIRKWRRRLPLALKASIARRLTEYLTGMRSPQPDDGLHREFVRTLRRRALAE